MKSNSALRVYVYAGIAFQIAAIVGAVLTWLVTVEPLGRACAAGFTAATGVQVFAVIAILLLFFRWAGIGLRYKIALAVARSDVSSCDIAWNVVSYLIAFVFVGVLYARFPIAIEEDLQLIPLLAFGLSTLTFWCDAHISERLEWHGTCAQ